MSRVALAACTLVFAAGCSAGQSRIATVFSTDWQDDGGRSISAVEAKLRGHPIANGANVAVGVVANGLVGVVLDSGSTWTFAHVIDARPRIAGSLVVGTGGGEVFALDAETGRSVWARPATGKIRGAGDDGATTIVSLEPAGQKGGGLLAIARDGRVLRQIEPDVAVGDPAIVSNLAFVPWANQYVTVLDVGTGDEVARVTLREQTSHVFEAGGALYFGEIGVTRFDDRIGEASRNNARRIGLPERELPGKPRWMRPGGFVLDKSADAFDRIAAYALPTYSGDRLGLDSDRYYATYYRVVVGLSGGAGELLWARALDKDALAGAAYRGGVALCLSSGKVELLAASDGATTGSVDLGSPVSSCVVQADSMQGKPAGAKQPPLVDQLTAVVTTRDTELATMQRFLLRELIGQPSDLATKTLIDVASNPETSPALLDDARAGLAVRRNGAEYMLEALARHYDFLKDVMAVPPVGPMADALLAMKESRAAPHLAAHLNDPADSADDIKRVARALAELATAQEMGQLQTFFSLYRTAADSPDLVSAVVDVAKAIVRLGGPDGRKLVTEAASDPLTVPELRQALSDLPKTATTQGR